MSNQNSNYYESAIAGQISPSEQSDVIAQAKRKARKKLIVQFIAFVVIAGGAFLSWCAIVFEMNLEEYYIDFGMLLAMVPTVIVIVFLANKFSHITNQHVMLALKKRGVRPIYCLICHYDLSHVSSSNCPECGELLTTAETATSP